MDQPEKIPCAERSSSERFLVVGITRLELNRI